MKKKIKDSIINILKEDFSLSTREIEIILQIFNNKAPDNINQFIENINNLPEDLHLNNMPTLKIDDETITFTSHKANLLHAFINKEYGRKFGSLYMSAFLLISPTSYLNYLQHLNKIPFGEIIKQL